MFKWLILAALILLAASLTGDILLIHHHMSGSQLESEQLAAGTIITSLLVLPAIIKDCRGLSLNAFYSHRTRKGFLRYFCGWHNSVSLKVLVLAYYQTPELEPLGVFYL